MTESTPGPAPLAKLSGLELLQLRLIESDDRPPSIGQLIGMTMTRIELGGAEFSLVTQPSFSNPLGTVHGGIAATILDSAMGCAVHSTLGPGDWYTTLELKVNYIRATQTNGERLIVTGNTIHVGRTTATAEGQVRNEAGKLVAHGTTTCIIRRADGRPT